MPIKYFKCTDGNKSEIEECYKKCRLNNRCMCLPALMSAGRQRKWLGKPSVTQLLKGTRESYLQIVNDITIDPFNQIASMIGTNSHSLMENVDINGWLKEVRLENDITSGQFDAVDLLNKTLWDYKFFNDYKVAMVLGYRSRWVADGVYVRGAKKGQTKWKQVYEAGGVCDVLEIAIQLSYYKYLLKLHGIEVDKINVQVFLRGGLTKNARNLGLTQTAYIVPIKPLSEHWVRKYMQMKYDALMKALDTQEMPPACGYRNRWKDDRKCKDYCSANEFCPYWQEKYGGKSDV